MNGFSPSPFGFRNDSEVLTDARRNVHLNYMWDNTEGKCRMPTGSCVRRAERKASKVRPGCDATGLLVPTCGVRGCTSVDAGQGAQHYLGEQNCCALCHEDALSACLRQHYVGET